MSHVLSIDEVKAFQDFYGLAVDGIWGPKTQAQWDKAFPMLVKVPDDWSHSYLAPPSPDYSAMVAYYGQPGDTSQHTRISCPWPLYTSWDNDGDGRLKSGGDRVSGISCHKKIADPLSAVLATLWEELGIEKIKAYGLDLYGGCYNNRKTRGGTSTSKHAWAAAIDFDPARNGNQTPWHKDRVGQPGYAHMPEEVIQIFEHYGFLSGGRAWGRDAMHFQYTT